MSTKTVSATSNGIRMSSRKVGLVASLVRGRTVEDAVTILEHTPKSAARPISKVILSAQANAKNNHKLDPKTLTIETLEVNGTGMMKRYRPGAQGRAKPYRHRISSVRVVLSGEPVQEAAKMKSTAKTENTKEEK